VSDGGVYSEALGMWASHQGSWVDIPMGGAPPVGIGAPVPTISPFYADANMDPRCINEWEYSTNSGSSGKAELNYDVVQSTYSMLFYQSSGYSILNYAGQGGYLAMYGPRVARVAFDMAASVACDMIVTVTDGIFNPIECLRETISIPAGDVLLPYQTTETWEFITATARPTYLKWEPVGAGSAFDVRLNRIRTLDAITGELIRLPGVL
jgi:hypothetical protein